MGIQIDGCLVAEMDVGAVWYLRDTTTSCVSKEYFISLRVIERCVMIDRPMELTWVHEEREPVPIEEIWSHLPPYMRDLMANHTGAV